MIINVDIIHTCREDFQEDIFQEDIFQEDIFQENRTFLQEDILGILM